MYLSRIAWNCSHHWNFTVPFYCLYQLSLVPFIGNIIQYYGCNIDIRLEMLVSADYSCYTTGHPGCVNYQNNRNL